MIINFIKTAYLRNNGEIMIRIILALLFIFKISASFSHSQLSEILPKDNVTYVKVPSQINMKFNSLVKLVKVVMIRVDKKEKINLDLTSLPINIKLSELKKCKKELLRVNNRCEL